VYAHRALSGVDEIDPDLAGGWHNLAMAHSYHGFHAHALSAIEPARQIGGPAGVPPEHVAQPGSRLRLARSMDHHGDSDGCLRVLRDLITELDQYDRAQLRPAHLVAYGYAMARQAALDANPESPGGPW